MTLDEKLVEFQAIKVRERKAPTFCPDCGGSPQEFHKIDCPHAIIVDSRRRIVKEERKDEERGRDGRAAAGGAGARD